MKKIITFLFVLGMLIAPDTVFAQKDSTISVSPVPVTSGGWVTAVFNKPSTKGWTVRFIRADGKALVVSQRITTNRASFQLPAVYSGVYLLHFFCEDQDPITKKIVVFQN